MANALAAEGYQVVLVGPTSGRAPSRIAVHPAVTVRTFELPTPAKGALGQIREQVVSTGRAARALRALAREAPVDVLHVGNPPDNGWLFTSMLGVVQGFRPLFVYDQHDPAPLLVADKFGNSVRMRGVAITLEWFERMSLRRAHLAVFANEPFRDRASDGGMLRGPAVVAPNGWSLPRPGDAALPWRDYSQPLVTYVGTTNTQDCLTHLVRAIALMHAPVQVAVAGDGDARWAAEELARELGVGERFVWLGWVRDRALIARLVGDAAVCVAPERPSPANDLTSFVKVVEYLSLGAAVVAHRLPQTERVAGTAIEYADDVSADALAAAIERLIEDPARGRARAQAAMRRFDERLSWDAVGSRLLVDGYSDAILPLLANGAASGSATSRRICHAGIGRE